MLYRFLSTPDKGEVICEACASKLNIKGFEMVLYERDLPNSYEDLKCSRCGRQPNEISTTPTEV